MGALGNIGKRLAMLAIVVLGSTFLLSLLIQFLPGNPEDILSGGGNVVFADEIARETGLDKGPIGYYLQWLGNFVTGDFGNFYTNGVPEPVSDRLSVALPPTLLLILYTQIFSLLVSIPLGVLTAYKEGSRFDKITSSVLFSLSSIPGFATGLVLAVVVGVNLGWVDPLGYVAPSENFSEHIKLMILPVLSLSMGLMSTYTRLLRSDVIATLKEDFVTMAASKGISNGRILTKHVFRASGTTLFTAAALNMGALIGGAIVVEIIFAIPGMGFELVSAIATQQIIALQSMIAIIAVAYVLFNAASDALANAVDPRTRERRA